MNICTLIFHYVLFTLLSTRLFVFFFICRAASVYLTGSQDTCYTLLITDQYNLSEVVVSHLLLRMHSYVHWQCC